MNAARFAHPEWIPALVLVVGLAGLGVLLSWSRARRRADALLGDRGAVGASQLGRDALLVLALAGIAFALVGPRIGVRTMRVPSFGVDVVLLLDVSRSMDARDLAPSRLARAQQLAAGLLAALEPGDRAALAAFGSRGVLLTPLTPDHSALTAMLPALDSTLVQARGSNLEAGVQAAVAAFDSSSDRPRSLFVVSDGEDSRRGDALGIEAARRARVRVVSVALGTEAGAEVPDGGVPLVDRAGRTVVSRRDAARLDRLARATDGAPFVADRWGEIDLEGARAAVRREAGDRMGELVERRVAATRVAPWAALAFALLWLELAGVPRPKRRVASGATAVVGAGALGVFLLGATAKGPAEPSRASPSTPATEWLEARLRDAPADADLLVALGVARAQAGFEDEARRALRAAALSAREPRQAALAYYDLGVLELEQRRYEEARDAFLEAVALEPGDREARFNLEWTLRALQANESHAPGPKPGEPPPEPGEKQAADQDSEARVESPEPSPAPDEREKGSDRDLPRIDPRELEQWLETVPDEQRRALRDRDAGEPHRERGPVW